MDADIGVDADMGEDADAPTMDADAGPQCDGGTLADDAGTCVECLTNAECTDPASPVCVTGVCEECDSADMSAERDQSCQDLEGARDVCGPDDTCVECLPGAAPGGAPLAGCLGAERPVCGTDNTCGTCVTDDDCRRFAGVDAASGTPSCGPAGACVQCTLGDAAFACSSDRVARLPAGSFSVCDPAANTCTNIRAGSRSRCEDCTFDAQCGAGDACVQVFNSLEMEGNRCIPRASAGGVCNEPGYPKLVTNRTSVNGAGPEPFCSIDEDKASCAAVLRRRDDSECTAPGSLTICNASRSACAGGIEGKPNDRGVCTYACTAGGCEPGYTCQRPAMSGIPANPEVCVKII